MHTAGCYAAIHRVCANLVAMKQKEQGVPNSALGALTPPGPPVSMAGVPVAISADRSKVAVACSSERTHENKLVCMKSPEMNELNIELQSELKS